MAASVSARRGLGVTAGLDPTLARDVAAYAEELGYHSLWANDEPTAPGLQTLADFAAATTDVELGVGVLPLHRHQPTEIAVEIDRLALDPARLSIGIGSGPLRGRSTRSSGRSPNFARCSPTPALVLAAMRPRLCRLAGAMETACC